MRHSFQPSEMYGENYGYRSGLNQSMIDHLKSKATYPETFANVRAGDVVLDIGSNDGTFLSVYSNTSVMRLGIAPSALERLFAASHFLTPQETTAKHFN